MDREYWNMQLLGQEEILDAYIENRSHRNLDWRVPAMRGAHGLYNLISPSLPSLFWLWKMDLLSRIN